MDQEEINLLNTKTKSSSLPLILLIPITLYILTFSAIAFISTLSLPAHRTLGPVSCPNVANDTIFCDRTDYNTDVCYMRGDVRTDVSSHSILLLSNHTPSPDKTLRPYPRKFEPFVMKKIPELRLRTVDAARDCDVRHDVPAIVFSAGGYTGNVFHAFNDGLIPLHTTSRGFNRKVVFVVLQYRQWWHRKYREIISELTDYPLVDLSNDTRVHCFPEATVGLRTRNNLTLVEFRRVVENAYNPEGTQAERGDRPKIVFVSRTGNRVVENEEVVVGCAREVGFDVEVLSPRDGVPMRAIYRALSSCDVMIGVHGAALTHLLFMRPGTLFLQVVLIGVHGAALTHLLFMRPGTLFLQVVPIGLEKWAWACYGEMAAAIGVRYNEYRVMPRESSLWRKYGEGDPIVKDPERVMAKGWEVTKEVYLGGQNVTLDIGRIRERLVPAFEYATAQRTIRRQW